MVGFVHVLYLDNRCLGFHCLKNRKAHSAKREEVKLRYRKEKDAPLEDLLFFYSYL